MLTAIVDARILTPDEEIERGNVLVRDGRIVDVGRDLALPPEAQVLRLTGLTLVPGFIDIHVHGGGGFSLATRDPDELRAYARWVAAKGVTSFLATVCAASLEEACGFLRAAAPVVGPIDGGAELLGLNLEGPFVNPARRGALPESWLIAPDAAAFRALADAAAGRLALMTLAPEMPGAARVMGEALSRDATVAVGHTDADYDQALAAFRAGASHLTHAFNAMRPFHHRDPGPVAAAVDSQTATVEVIADGAHLHPATVRLLARALGARAVLVTDGVTPAGLPSGAVSLGGREARSEGGRVLLPDGTIAGSAATMDRAVRNLVRWGAAGLADAVAMASAAPAAVRGLHGRKGRIAPGYDADLVALDEELAVVMTWVGGRLVHDPGRPGRPNGRQA
ncbi:MAG TPA: N-acetylglucosamine-6-phosphate deacetylase [Dehalococcoidia bacterium]|nr:N-acetylglucosamine-6-phosphate deacetylase [Dehalococcoidia bacterium]